MPGPVPRRGGAHPFSAERSFGAHKRTLGAIAADERGHLESLLPPTARVKYVLRGRWMEPTRCPSFGGRRPVFRLLPRNPDQWRCVGDFRPIFTELVTTYFLSNSRPSRVEGSSAFFRRRRTCVSWTKSSVAPPPRVKSATLSGRPARYGEKPSVAAGECRLSR